MSKKAEEFFDIPQVQKIGIYAIRNKSNNKYYIGSSVNVYNRMLTHARSILRYGGINIHMAKDLKKKDYKNLEFIVLKTFEDGVITDRKLRDKEWKMILKYQSHISGYNKAGTHGNGCFSEEQLLYCPVVKVSKKKETKKEAKKENCDRISATLPKGTTDRIKALGLTVNGFINDLVLAELERLERDKSSEPPF